MIFSYTALQLRSRPKINVEVVIFRQISQDSHLVAVEGHTPEEGHQHQIQDGDLLVSVLPSECFTFVELSA